MAQVKICGLTNTEDALKAVELGADLLGFIFIRGTVRYSEDLEGVILGIPEEEKAKVGIVGLFKDEGLETVAKTVKACKLGFVQLHGSESPEYCRDLKEALGGEAEIMKVFKVKEEILPIRYHILDDYIDADYFVFDAFHPELAGGTGEKFGEEALAEEKDKIKKPFFVAGGLNPGNVADVIRHLQPYGVDVSSGVERVPGKKDAGLLKEFIENAKKS